MKSIEDKKCHDILSIVKPLLVEPEYCKVSFLYDTYVIFMSQSDMDVLDSYNLLHDFEKAIHTLFEIPRLRITHVS